MQRATGARVAVERAKQAKSYFGSGKCGVRVGAVEKRISNEGAKVRRKFVRAEARRRRESILSPRLRVSARGYLVLRLRDSGYVVETSWKEVAVPKRMGENIDSEWERDPYADQVWDALQLIKTESEQGLAALLDLGAKGSSLALMYAGHRYRDGINNVPKNEETAIGLLNKSLELGSIEGGYLLAHLHMSNQRYKDGVDTYDKIIDLVYSPAMYSLGYYYVFGDPSIRNVEKGAKLFERAACIGHFYAKHEFANLLIRRGTWDEIGKGLFIKIRSVIPYLYYRSNYPNSDRLRA